MSQRSRTSPRKRRASSARRVRRFRLGDPGKRMNGALIVTLALLLVIGGRLLQLQGVEAAAFASSAGSPIKSKVLAAERGAITDKNGTQLAYSIQTRTLYADPGMIKDNQRAPLAALISDKLTMPYADVMAALLAKGRYAIIAKDIDVNTAEDIRTAEIDGERVTGIGTERTQKRIYPASTTAGQIVGFTNKDQGDGKGVSGLAGIEQSMNAVLAGKDGKLVYESSPDGSVIPAGIQQTVPAEPGSTVELTIDADLQYLVQNDVLTYQANNPAASAVSVVALDAKTGQVVAMFGTPGYDPANLGAAKGDDLANPTVSSVLEPGSVQKVTTMGPALEKGIISPTSVLSVPGSIPVADVTVRDAWVHGTLDFTATGIFAKSSNVGTLLINQKLDKDYYYEMLQKFGEGQKTGIELPAESRGILAPRNKWSGSQVGNVPIGQGVSLTPLQMASVFQTIANDGNRMPPRIVKSVTGANGKSTPTAAPSAVPVLSKSATDDLKKMLEAVTGDGGTGKAAVVPGYRVGGKTGTGQRANPACNCYEGGGYYHTFVGMAPIEDPKYVVAIAITDPTASVGGGASPLFSQIMGQILRSAAVLPSTEPSPKYQLASGE